MKPKYLIIVLVIILLVLITYIIIQKNQNSNTNLTKTQENYQNIKKIEASKDWVYRGDIYKGVHTYDSIDDYNWKDTYIVDGQNYKYPYIYEYPIININSEDVKKINLEIYENFWFDSSNIKNKIIGGSEYCGYLSSSYYWYINNNILSLFIFCGERDSTWYYIYNIDLETGKQIENSKLIDTNIDLESIRNKFIKYAINRMQEDLNNVMSDYEGMFYSKQLDEYLDVWNDVIDDKKEELEQELKEFNNIYLNSNGDIIIVAKFETIGGQETCQKVMTINASKNGEVSEFNIENIVDKYNIK